MTASAVVLGQYAGTTDTPDCGTASTCSADTPPVYTAFVANDLLDTAYFQGDASADAGYGILHSFASATQFCTVVNPGVTCFYQGSANAVATFSDVFTLTDAPESGYLDFTWGATGSNTVDCTGPDAVVCGNSFAQTQFLVGGDSLQSGEIIQLTGDDTFDVPILFNSVNGTAMVGVEMSLVSSIRCLASNITSCTATSDFSDTAIVTALSVRDSMGQLDSGVQIASQSGTDYNNIVPEPNTFGIFACAVFLIATVEQVKRALRSRAKS